MQDEKHDEDQEMSQPQTTRNWQRWQDKNVSLQLHIKWPHVLANKMSAFSVEGCTKVTEYWLGRTTEFEPPNLDNLGTEVQDQGIQPSPVASSLLLGSVGVREDRVPDSPEKFESD